MEDNPIDTRSRIREAAVELFLEHGIEATSLRRIADELGVTKAALYYHYPSKLDLIRATTTPLLDDMDALMSELEATPDLTPQQVLEAYFDFTIEHLMIYQMLMRNPGIIVHLDLVKLALDWRKRYEVMLVGQNADADARARATIAFGGLSDCVVMLTDVPASELRVVAVRAACQTLGVEYAQPAPTDALAAHPE